ncbi:hypothetical protein BDV95DRAFT_590762 [Massariosphaeria phaeospora]|uniref:Thaumatin family-domain-containing protein n=1 Tax=Massariosphaeria phaeospora TaxID=100035 RepID=A0A7C8IDF0_9PLEO|nr:hypothetical protein BDV95DRAFT_590762 [Massariosphaeria phaeospora]
MSAKTALRVLILVAALRESSATEIPNPLLPAVASKRQAATTTSPFDPRPPEVPRQAISDNGGDWGNVVIRNNCDEKFYFWSIGAWHKSKAAEKEGKLGSLEANGVYTEPYRITCPTDTPCESQDKVAGAGVSIKLSRTKEPPKEPDIANVTQIEYALLQKPGEPFHKLNYDFSLLDCAKVNVTDIGGTAAQHDDKVKLCPGYAGGVAVTFDNDPDYKSCEPVYCDGLSKCLVVYTYDRTREGEPSLSCKEYHGNMIVDLCVNKNSTAKDAGKAQFDSWAATAENGALKYIKTAVGAPNPAGTAAPPAAAPVPPAGAPAAPIAPAVPVPAPARRAEDPDTAITTSPSQSQTLLTDTTPSITLEPISTPTNPTDTSISDENANADADADADDDQALSTLTDADLTPTDSTPSCENYDSSTLNTCFVPTSTAEELTEVVETSTADADTDADASKPQEVTMVIMQTVTVYAKQPLSSNEADAADPAAVADSNQQI